MSLCYLAEAIDTRNGHSTSSGDELTRQLEKTGLAVYRPLKAWTGGRTDPTAVETINRAALRESAVLVADWSCGSRSVGVPAEIEHATRTLGIPALVIYHGHSVALAANPLVTIAGYDQSLPQIAEHASRLAHGVHPDRRNLLRYTLCAPTAQPPTRAYDDDAGIDLIVRGDHTIQPGSFLDIPTTVTGIQTPPDTWLMVTGRSSTFRKKGLHVPVSIIDPGWRGPLLVGAWNYTNKPVHLEAGDRIGQVIAIHNRTAELTFIHTDTLDPHPRGTAGFGSTG
jgi:deoxyuridine 5'-triphosphate nucleotidohydrolase